MKFLEVLAHEGEEVVNGVVNQPSLGDTISTNSIKYSLIAAVLLIILVILSHLFKGKNEILKKILFWSMMVVIVLNTLYLAAATIYLNVSSKSGGPVHYHADFEIYNCGKEVTVEKPEGLSNKVGTALIHTHNDKRMHVEGVILGTHELTLGHFFESLGGNLDNGMLTVPTDQGKLILKDGDVCPDGKKGTLQVFVLRTKDKLFEQRKLTDFKNYSMSTFTQVPPGDCVIFQFDSKNIPVTNKMCQSYRVAKQAGKIYGR